MNLLPGAVLGRPERPLPLTGRAEHVGGGGGGASLTGRRLHVAISTRTTAACPLLPLVAQNLC